MTLKLRVLAAVLSLAVLALAAVSQQMASTAPTTPSASSTPPTSGPRAEFLNELKGEEGKFIALAEAVPSDKYPWRPADGVRSISEVFLHVAAANYNLPKLIGTPPPAGFKPQGFDKSATDKAKVIEILKDSFNHLRVAVMNMPDSDLEKQLDWFGGKNTERGILLFIMRHMGEHLGQSIAYARIEGIVPPWTEEQQREQKKPQEKPKQ